MINKGPVHISSPIQFQVFIANVKNLKPILCFRPFEQIREQVGFIMEFLLVWRNDKDDQFLFAIIS